MNSYKKTYILAALVILTFIFPRIAVAKSPSYEMTSGSYLVTEYDGQSTGFAFEATRSFNKNVFWGIGYSLQEGTSNESSWRGSEDVKLTSVAFGLGYHSPITRSTDFYNTLSYAHIETEIEHYNDIDGYAAALELGFRSMLTRKLELSTAIAMIKIKDAKLSENLQLGMYYYLAKDFSAGFNYVKGEDSYSYSMSARFHY